MPNPPVELKPCPFCGGEDIELVFPDAVFGSTKIVCVDCNATRYSVTAWNHRPIEDALTARVKALEKAGDALYRRLEDISDDGEAIDQWAALAEGGGD